MFGYYPFIRVILQFSIIILSYVVGVYHTSITAQCNLCGDAILGELCLCFGGQIAGLHPTPELPGAFQYGSSKRGARPLHYIRLSPLIVWCRPPARQTAEHTRPEWISFYSLLSFFIIYFFCNVFYFIFII